jgi:membrane protease subunit (stomatin/prohibitin family)
MRLLGAMLVGGATASIVGRHSARRQFEAMSAAQAQQEQINQAQAQAAQAVQTAQAAQASNQGKKDTLQELERLGSLKQQGLITEEEFQKLKTRLLSSI